MTGTRNDGKTPAWQHPIDVMNVVGELMQQCGDHESREDLEVVALLHDIIEDTPIEFGELDEQYGWGIAKAVSLLTKPDGCRFGTPALVTYFHRLMDDTSEKAADIARIVKCCDRIANLREAVGVFKPYRLERYKFETKMFVIPIAMKIPDPWGPWLKSELEGLSIAQTERKRRRTA